MHTRTIAIVATVALGAAGAGFWMAARESPELFPQRMPPPRSADTGLSQDRQGRAGVRAPDHYVQLEHALGRALVARDPHQRETAFTHLLPELLQSEPRRVTATLLRQAPGEPRDALRDEIARQWVRIDRDAAIRWIESLEVEAERLQVAQLAVDSLAASVPSQAIVVADRFALGRDNGYLEHLVQIWAESDLAEAERWLETQPDDSRTAPLRARIERVQEQRKTSGRG